MIRCEMTSDGFVAFELTGYVDIVAVTVRYRCGEEWKPASLYKSLDVDDMLERSDSRYWNQAIEKGIVKYRADETQYAFYWHKYLNIRQFAGKVEVSCEILSRHGVDNETLRLALYDDDTRYWNDWSSAIEAGSSREPDHGRGQWLVSRDFGGLETIAADTDAELPPLAIAPKLQGWFDLYIGLASGLGALSIHTSECRHKTILMTGGSIDLLYNQNFGDKRFKEIRSGKYRFQETTTLYISPLRSDNATKHKQHFAYIKLVPSRAPQSLPTNPGRELALFFEPDTHAAWFRMLSPDDVCETLDMFLKLAPTEITCQVGRIGMKAAYHSHIIDRIDLPYVGDDQLVHGGQSVMVRNMDVLKVAADYCKDKNVLFTVNLGVNRPYLHLGELSESFVRNNPNKLKDGFLNYTDPAVMDYALRIIEEIAKRYDIDGLSLDFMRTEANQTRDTLSELIGRTRDVLQRCGNGSRLRLSVRIPAESSVYFEAAKIWVQERLVDVIIPSNTVEMEPLPRVEHYVALCDGSSTKVYGCIDGWKKMLLTGQSYGIAACAMSPADIRQTAAHYRACRVNGLFVYEGENYAFNPFVAADTFE